MKMMRVTKFMIACVLAGALAGSAVQAGLVPSATFVANWNGGTAQSGVAADYSLGGVSATSIGGIPGPVVSASVFRFGGGALDLTSVLEDTSDPANPDLHYAAQNVVNPNAGTVMFWINHNTTVTAGHTLQYFWGLFPEDGGNANIIVGAWPSLGRLGITVNDGVNAPTTFTGTTAFPGVNDGAWHHVAATWDNTTDTVAVYIHNAAGALQFTAGGVITSWSLSAPTASQRFAVTQNDYKGFAANAFLDDYAISSEALSLAQIETAMTGEAVVPEPGTLTLVLVACCGGLLLQRRRSGRI